MKFDSLSALSEPSSSDESSKDFDPRIRGFIIGDQIIVLPKGQRYRTMLCLNEALLRGFGGQRDASCMEQLLYCPLTRVVSSFGTPRKDGDKTTYNPRLGVHDMTSDESRRMSVNGLTSPYKNCNNI